VGKKKQPLYRIIVNEKSHDPWGKALELLGTYNPHTHPATVVLKKDRINFWIGKGSQCSDTVWNMLVDQGVVTGEKRKQVHISKVRQAKLDKKKK